jgi:hypothetical protein
MKNYGYGSGDPRIKIRSFGPVPDQYITRTIDQFILGFYKNGLASHRILARFDRETSTGYIKTLPPLATVFAVPYSTHSLMFFVLNVFNVGHPAEA